MGQEIFADGYIVEGKISVNNAAINGETKECKKSPIPGYIHAKTTSTSAYTNPNCLFAGTTVMAGEGKMVVTDVGVNTVNGDTMVKMQTLESPKTALDIAPVSYSHLDVYKRQDLLLTRRLERDILTRREHRHWLLLLQTSSTHG